MAKKVTKKAKGKTKGKVATGKKIGWKAKAKKA
jgi:hypothetical protein